MAWTKLDQSILDSTVWQESLETKIVWITMLAMTNEKGEVRASIPGLARRACVNIQECEKAVDRLSSPDYYSRSKNNDGRRIVAIEGGWLLVNHSKYRAKTSTDRVREWRSRNETLRNVAKRCETGETGETASDQIRSYNNNNKQQVACYSDDFEDFWRVYPARNGRKAGKKPAYEQWKKTKKSRPDNKSMIEILKKHVEIWKIDEYKFVPDAQKWLRSNSWEDDIVQITQETFMPI